MDQPYKHELDDTVGTDKGRTALLKEIIDKVEGLDVAGSDDDIDRWWGTVEVDRLASGLTLATIDRLVDQGNEDDASEPWLQRSDATGDEVTQLTPAGRAALRQVGSIAGPVSEVSASEENAH
jgi:hypothetical protein